MKTRALELIEAHSKTWLCEKLDISRPTLDTRLKKDNWKKPEIQMLLIISK